MELARRELQRERMRAQEDSGAMESHPSSAPLPHDAEPQNGGVAASSSLPAQPAGTSVSVMSPSTPLHGSTSSSAPNSASNSTSNSTSTPSTKTASSSRLSVAAPAPSTLKQHTSTQRASLPAGFPLSLSPPLVSRNLPSPPPLEEDSDDDVELPLLSQILSQMRPEGRGRSGGVDENEGEEGDDEEDADEEEGGEGSQEGSDEEQEIEGNEEEDDEEIAGNGGEDSEEEDAGSDMYVDEELTNVKEEDLDDHTLSYLPEHEGGVKTEDPAEDHEGNPIVKQEEEFDQSIEDEDDSMPQDEDLNEDEDMEDELEGVHARRVEEEGPGDEDLVFDSEDERVRENRVVGKGSNRNLTGGEGAIESLLNENIENETPVKSQPSSSEAAEGAHRPYLLGENFPKKIDDIFDRAADALCRMLDHVSASAGAEGGDGGEGGKEEGGKEEGGEGEDEDGGEEDSDGEGEDEDGEGEDASYVPEDEAHAGDGEEEEYVDPANGKYLSSEEEREDQLEVASWDGEEGDEDEELAPQHPASPNPNVNPKKRKAPLPDVDADPGDREAGDEGGKSAEATTTNEVANMKGLKSKKARIAAPDFGSKPRTSTPASAPKPAPTPLSGPPSTSTRNHPPPSSGHTRNFPPPSFAPPRGRPTPKTAPANPTPSGWGTLGGQRRAPPLSAPSHWRAPAPYNPRPQGQTNTVVSACVPVSGLVGVTPPAPGSGAGRATETTSGSRSGSALGASGWRRSVNDPNQLRNGGRRGDGGGGGMAGPSAGKVGDPWAKHPVPSSSAKQSAFSSPERPRIPILKNPFALGAKPAHVSVPVVSSTLKPPTLAPSTSASITTSTAASTASRHPAPKPSTSSALPASTVPSTSSTTSKPPVSKPSASSTTNSSSSTSKPASKPPTLPNPSAEPSTSKPPASSSTSKPSTSSSTATKPPKPTPKKHAYTKHQTHWHLDGSLLVQLGNVRYRVHRSRMGRVSGVFGRALGGSVGSSGDNGKSGKGKGSEKSNGKGKGGDGGKGRGVRVEYEEDGPPLVRLDGTGVQREDWEALLDGMDGAVTYIYTPPPLPFIASLLRASHILAVPSFEKYARKAFEDVWSGELESLGPGAFDSTQAGGDTGERAGNGRIGTPKAGVPRDIRSLGVSATEAVLVGRLCGLPGVVKRGMYELVKSETFEQGEDADEDDGEGEGSDGERSVIVIDSDSDDGYGGNGGGKKGGGKANANANVNGKAKSNGKTKQTRKRLELTQKDYMKLTSARSKLLSRWMRETAQFPEGMLPCAGEGLRDEVNEGNSRDETKEDGGWNECAGADPLAAREAHRKLVLQSGVQEAYMNDVVTGLGVLPRLNWGFSPPGRTRAGSRKGKGKEPARGQGDNEHENMEEDDGEEEEEYYGGFCDECAGKLEKMWGGARERVWRDCEVLFGVKRQTQKG